MIYSEAELIEAQKNWLIHMEENKLPFLFLSDELKDAIYHLKFWHISVESDRERIKASLIVHQQLANLEFMVGYMGASHIEKPIWEFRYHTMEGDTVAHRFTKSDVEFHIFNSFQWRIS